LQTSASQPVTLTNAGNYAVTISQLTVAGPGFSSSGLSLPITLAVGQSTSFNTIFDPTTAGNLAGTVTIVSTATNSPLTIALSGTGAAPVSYSVSLSWQASTSSVAGYNVYVASQSGGPYTRVNSSPVISTSYSDTNVLAGDTYYFVTTAVDSAGDESAYSNQVSALLP
jgi:fibronectin type 3 domain-containing protein